MSDWNEYGSKYFRIENNYTYRLYSFATHIQQKTIHEQVYKNSIYQVTS